MSELLQELVEQRDTFKRGAELLRDRATRPENDPQKEHLRALAEGLQKVADQCENDIQRYKEKHPSDVG